jgi:hypothetical protein
MNRMSTAAADELSLLPDLLTFDLIFLSSCFSLPVLPRYTCTDPRRHSDEQDRLSWISSLSKAFKISKPSEEENKAWRLAREHLKDGIALLTADDTTDSSADNRKKACTALNEAMNVKGLPAELVEKIAEEVNIMTILGHLLDCLDEHEDLLVNSVLLKLCF